jgi:hypothetical protein
MTSNAILFALILLAWIAFVVLCVRIRASFVPIVPTAPALLLGTGLLLNHWTDWLGTILVAAIHLAAILVVGVRVRRLDDAEDSRSNRKI